MPKASGRFVVQKHAKYGWMIADTQHNAQVNYGYGSKAAAEKVVPFLDKQLAAGHTTLTVAGPPDFTSRTRYCVLCGQQDWRCTCQPVSVRRRHAGELAEIDREILEILLQAKNTPNGKYGLEPMSFASKLMLPSSVCRQRLRALFNRGLVTGRTGGMYSWGAMKTSQYTLTDQGEAALKSGQI